MTRVLFDTDLAMGTPGSDIDDGFALALALAEPTIDVELVTTVHGNTDVDTASRLSAELLSRLGRPDLPVVRGAAFPLSPRLRRPGWDGADSTRATNAGAHAATVLAETAMAEPGAFTVVAIGPLTNLALALLLEPRLATAVHEVVVMGGAFLEQTNVAALPGEFNMWSDPHAAAVVLASHAPLRFVGLDVTRRVRLSRADAQTLAAAGGDFADFAARCTDEWITHQEREKPHEEAEHGSCALHDPLAVAVVAHPELVSWRPAHVQVETSSPVTRGVAVADLLTHADPPEPNCRIATDVDADAFHTWFLDRMSALP